MASAKLGHGGRRDDDDEESSNSDEEGGGAPMMKPAPAAAPAAAAAAASPPAATTIHSALAALASAAQSLSTIALAAPPGPILGESPLKAGDTTTIKFHYDVKELAKNLVDAKGAACLALSMKNVRVEYETPEIAAAVGKGLYLFTAVKSEHKGTFNHERTLDISYLGFGPGVVKTIDAPSLARNLGAFTVLVINAPLTETKRTFIKLHGKHHGDNMDTVFVRLPDTDKTLVLGNTVPALALALRQLGVPGTTDVIPSKELDAESGLREISSKHEAAVKNYAKDVMRRNLNFFDPTKFAMEIRARASTDMHGKPLKATFADNASDCCEFKGVLEITCAFCESIAPAPAK